MKDQYKPSLKVCRAMPLVILIEFIIIIALLVTMVMTAKRTTPDPEPIETPIPSTQPVPMELSPEEYVSSLPASSLDTDYIIDVFESLEFDGDSCTYIDSGMCYDIYQRTLCVSKDSYTPIIVDSDGEHTTDSTSYWIYPIDALYLDNGIDQLVLIDHKLYFCSYYIIKDEDLYGYQCSRRVFPADDCLAMYEGKIVPYIEFEKLWSFNQFIKLCDAYRGGF